MAREHPPALGADAAGAAFDLTVYVQQARVVALSLLCADLRDRGPMAVGLMTESQLSPPSSQTFLHGSPTHRPLGNVIRPDVGPTGGRLFTGPRSRGQIEQNKRLGCPSLFMLAGNRFECDNNPAIFFFFSPCLLVRRLQIWSEIIGCGVERKSLKAV